MTPEQFVAQIKASQLEIEDLMNRQLPVKIGAMAMAYFKQNFIKSGFVNGGLQAWKPAKRLSRGATHNRGRDGKLSKKARISAANQYKTLLSSRDNLFNSFDYQSGKATVTIRNYAPYAAVHNEGLRAGRGKGFTMPKRQFMGDSRELNTAVQQKIETELRRILNF